MSALKTLWILIFVYVIVIDICFCCDDKSLNRSAFLDSNQTVFIQWIVNKTHLTMKVSGKTKGWLGIGFSPTGGMEGADIVIGWVKNGTTYLQDRHGKPDEDGIPVIDKHQDYMLKFGTENETHTIYCFERKLDTCDKEDFKITLETIPVIYAYSLKDPENEDEDALSYLENHRGTSSQNIVSRMYKRPTGPDVKYLDFRMPNITIPDGRDTYYWCQVFDLPAELETPHHIIGFEPLFDEGYEEFMHHLAAMNCIGNNITDMIKKGRGFECYTPQQTVPYDQCRQLAIMWTKGSKGTFYPDNVGFPFLSKIDGEAVFYVFNIHYDNPNKLKGIQINSGLRIYYTSKLRPNEGAGVLLEYRMLDPSFIIPPGQKKFTIPSHCTKECLAAMLPETGIRVFGYILHTHTAGRAVVVHHYRNGTELKPIANNSHYNFNYQQDQILDEERIILPGDAITLECTYNTEGRNTTTIGGESTRDEMCGSLLLYYSLIKLAICGGSVNYKVINDLVGIEELYPVTSSLDPIKIKKPSNLNNTLIVDYLKGYKWSDDVLKIAQERILKADQVPECVSYTGLINTKDLIGKYPKATKYEEENTCLGNEST